MCTCTCHYTIFTSTICKYNNCNHLHILQSTLVHYNRNNSPQAIEINPNCVIVCIVCHYNYNVHVCHRNVCTCVRYTCTSPWCMCTYYHSVHVHVYHCSVYVHVCHPEGIAWYVIMLMLCLPTEHYKIK